MYKISNFIPSLWQMLVATFFAGIVCFFSMIVADKIVDGPVVHNGACSYVFDDSKLYIDCAGMRERKIKDDDFVKYLNKTPVSCEVVKLATRLSFRNCK